MGRGGSTELCFLSLLKQNSVTLWLWISHSVVIIAYGHKILSLPKLFILGSVVSPRGVFLEVNSQCYHLL